MTDNTNAAYAATLLRVTTGTAFIAHGLLKVLVFTPAGTVGYFQSLGLPGALAYATIAIELIGGAALIAGVFTRAFSLSLIPVLLGAAIVHLPNGWLFSNAGGGWEFPVIWAAVMGAQALLGDGAYALSDRFQGEPRPANA